MSNSKNNYINPILVFLISFTILSFLQIKLANPMLLLERFVVGGGWIQIILASSFGAFLFIKLRNPHKEQKWRGISWTLFSIVFFAQFFLGISGYDKFLMTGDLHIPVPALILGGATYRLDFGFMPILFLSTILLTGPAWCSRLCYFGAIDNLAAGNKPKSRKFFAKMWRFKNIFLVLFIAISLGLGMFSIPQHIIVGVAISFGVIGIFIILFLSRKNNAMIHCTYYCPIGTLVSHLKFINPFRMYIDANCTNCQRCTSYCKYNALNLEDIIKRKPGKSCTFCGDCIESCPSTSIKFKLFNLNAEVSRNIYLIINSSVYVVFLSVARL